MTNAIELEHLQLTEEHRPENVGQVADVIREAYESGSALYPVGAGTNQNVGRPIRQPGIGLHLGGLQQMVEYTPRDMTVTVEAGIPLSELSRLLSAEHQELTVDLPESSGATLGGAISLNLSGARRYGQGTLRDYVIGIEAVDGRGTPFRGGGRVVKNVAGYDFCKLLIGSYGTLGVVTQVTLKVKPKPEHTAWIFRSLSDWDQAADLLNDIVHSSTRPTAVDVWAGAKVDQVTNRADPQAAATLAILFEGTTEEVAWQKRRLHQEWNEPATSVVEGAAAVEFQQELAEHTHRLPPADNAAELVLQAAVRPSRLVDVLRVVHDSLPDATVVAHAGNGIAKVHCGATDANDVVSLLLAKLHPICTGADGGIHVLRGAPEGITAAAMWGPRSPSLPLMHRVKEKFDPQNILNPGRFVFDG